MKPPIGWSQSYDGSLTSCRSNQRVIKAARQLSATINSSTALTAYPRLIDLEISLQPNQSSAIEDIFQTRSKRTELLLSSQT